MEDRITLEHQEHDLTKSKDSSDRPLYTQRQPAVANLVSEIP